MNSGPVRIDLPLTGEQRRMLKPGMAVLLNGPVYTARDAAHKRIVETLKSGKTLPFEMKNASIYYTGPSPAPKGRVIGSCGPTTSGRMDPYAPYLMAKGLKVMIGKGERTEPVLKAIRKHKAVYFSAIGGAAALMADKVISNELVAYPELGPEAVRKLELKDFPCFVAAM